ncbi:hypothetical protein BgiMline_023572 [Biomphalaria glabrata]|uniref:F-box domain-containing protein n=1 Tax=Biomphalaria glabrata TaxID=6526 RepID=A0A2C9LDJ6_BIOGL|nr:F-box only protein 36-like isoform X2 [Biomphalaria glabrata]
MADVAPLGHVCKHWVNEEGILYHSEGVSCAPKKDFYVLDITADELVMTVWKITNPFRVSSKETLAPKKFKCLYSEFKQSHEFRACIMHHGLGELEYIDNLIEGRIDYLSRVSKKIQLMVIEHLSLPSIYRLMRTNKYFKKLCSDDEVWQGYLMRNNLIRYATPGLEDIANTQGWKAYASVLLRLKKINIKYMNPVTKKSSGSSNSDKDSKTIARLRESLGSDYFNMFLADDESTGRRGSTLSTLGQFANDASAGTKRRDSATRRSLVQELTRDTVDLSYAFRGRANSLIKSDVEAPVKKDDQRRKSLPINKL